MCLAMALFFGKCIPTVCLVHRWMKLVMLYIVLCDFLTGFQPWAGLTGQQILEAIDEPNYQRLEKPDCCPHDIYYQIMLKCWQHDPENRPTFADLATRFLPEVSFRSSSCCNVIQNL